MHPMRLSTIVSGLPLSSGSLSLIIQAFTRQRVPAASPNVVEFWAWIFFSTFYYVFLLCFVVFFVLLLST